METKMQKQPFGPAAPAADEAKGNRPENVTRHGFPAWDLVPPRTPVRKEEP